jgi:hypothetical protein
MMTDAEFRELFALLDRPAEPWSELVERLLGEIDAVIAPAGVAPDSPRTTVHGPTGPDGSRPERAYLDAHEDQQMVAARPRTPRRRAIAVLAAAAAVIGVTVAVVVTRPSVHRQPNTVPTTPVAPATTTAPATTGVPTTLAPSPAPTITIVPGSGLTHVVGKGFVPGAIYTAAECANKRVETPEPYDCDYVQASSQMADPTGAISFWLVVENVFPVVDCTVAPGCVIRVTSADDSVTPLASVPIPFASSAGRGTS